MIEGLNVEFKLDYSDSIKKTVIAFANSNGGEILIGVDDKCNILGLKNPDETLLRVTNAIRDSIKPDVTIFVNCDIKFEEDKPLVVVSVQKGTACPYYLSNKGLRPEGVYIRQGASSVPATESAILKMILETSGTNFEEIRSLNQSLTFDYLYNEFSKANIAIGSSHLKTLSIIGKDGLYTNLGLLLSEQCTHSIKVAVFEGTSKEVFKDRYEFSGSLLKQLNECYSFIDRYNRTKAEFSGIKRIDKRDYPISAIREALLNSIVHRDYSYSGSTLISIFDNRIEFVTIGGLVKGISKEDMLLGVSILRNKNLANIFYRLELIEAFGTGIPKIIESYQDFSMTPLIETTDNAFKITLYNTMYEENYNTKINTRALAEGEKKVLEVFKDSDTVTRLELEEKLSISQATAINYLKSLLDKELIERIGLGKNTHYKLKNSKR